MSYIAFVGAVIFQLPCNEIVCGYWALRNTGHSSCLKESCNVTAPSKAIKLTKKVAYAKDNGHRYVVKGDVEEVKEG